MSNKNKKSSKEFKQFLNILNNLKIHFLIKLRDNLKISKILIFNMKIKLLKYGININGNKNQYELKETLFLLNKNLIIELTTNKNYSIEIYEALNSTNNNKFFKNHLYNKPHFNLTEFQSNGRGSLGKTWQSQFGNNIMFSLSYFFSRNIKESLSLSLIIAISIIDSLNLIGIKKKLKLKWPNDVYLNNIKISGCLIDIKLNNNCNFTAIIGIGLNINMLSQININNKWNSLFIFFKKQFNRNILFSNLIEIILVNLHIFNQKGFNFFLYKWDKLDLLKGNEISLIQSDNKKIFGKSLGVNNKGYLLLKNKKGKLNTFITGKAKLIKILK